MQCNIEKENLEKIKKIYEGYEKFKNSKMQTFSTQFEMLKMKEEEDIATYFIRVYENEFHNGT